MRGSDCNNFSILIANNLLNEREMKQLNENGLSKSHSNSHSNSNNLREGAWKAHVAMLLAVLGWGVMSPVSKAVMISGLVSPFALTGIRITGGALLFFLFSFIFPASMGTRQKIERRDWPRLILCSMLIISCNQALYILGIGLTSPIDSSVMCSLTPMLTMVLAAIFLRFPLTWFKVSGVVLGLVGVIALIMSTPQSDIAPNPLLGNILCLSAQLCAAIYYVSFNGIISRYAPYTLMKWLFLISVVTYVPFTIPELIRIPWGDLGLDIWLEIGYIVVVATFMGYLCIPFSQKFLKPTAVSTYSYLQPVFSAIASVMIGIGSFGWDKILATVIIFIGIGLVNRSK